MARRMLGSALAVALAATACSSGNDSGKGKGRGARTSTSAATAAPAPAVVFNGEGNNLNAISTAAPFEKQTVIRNHNDDPNGLDINAQICFFPDGSNRFIAGEDTGQPNPPQGWGIFQLRGKQVGKRDHAGERRADVVREPRQRGLDRARRFGPRRPSCRPLRLALGFAHVSPNRGNLAWARISIESGQTADVGRG